MAIQSNDQTRGKLQRFWQCRISRDTTSLMSVSFTLILVHNHPMPATALRHFNDDIDRARRLLDLGQNVVRGGDATLEGDCYRSSWMYAVGAMDAYFSDAYSDVLARLLRAKRAEPAVTVPVLSKVMLPMDMILASYAARENWKWRMAARGLMSDKNVLSVKDVKSYLNKMVHGNKLFQDPLLVAWIAIPGWTGWYGAAGGPFNADVTAGIAPMNGNDVREAITRRFVDICQRRHDCIHNCDRPRTRPQAIRSSQAKRAIDDVEWLIHRVDDWLSTGFCAFVTHLGFNAVTRNSIGC